MAMGATARWEGGWRWSWVVMSIWWELTVSTTGPVLAPTSQATLVVLLLASAWKGFLFSLGVKMSPLGEMF